MADIFLKLQEALNMDAHAVAVVVAVVAIVAGKHFLLLQNVQLLYKDATT